MTDPLAPRMRWWGWGVDGHDAPLPRGAVALLRDELGVGGARAAPAALDQVAARPSRRSPPPRGPQLAAAAGGEEHVRDDRLTRVTHAAGRSYPRPRCDCARARGLTAPDAVVYPADHDEVAAMLAVCAQHGDRGRPVRRRHERRRRRRALRGPFAAAISLDLARLSGLHALDARSQLATFGAGTLGPEAERLLAQHGLTLGHFPQSFEFSTVGGWAATRSAGQASTGYGRIDELVVALRAATPERRAAAPSPCPPAPPAPTCASSCSARRAPSASSPR